MADLGKRNDGRLLGFVTFDPRLGEQGLSLIRAAIEEQGFRGVKIYPGLGYVPNFPERIWIKFLDFVCEEEVPVFARCSPAGWEIKPHWSGLKSDPGNWEKMLNQKQFSHLRLCLGHAGGAGVKRRLRCRKAYYLGWADDWRSTSGPDGIPVRGNFAEKMAHLCRSFEHVYCDFSYHELLVAPSARHRDGSGRQRLIRNLVDAMQSNGKYELEKQIMYGSDFHMPTLASRTRQYLEAWADVMDEVAGLLKKSPQDLKNLFFSDNTREFLRIEKSE